MLYLKKSLIPGAGKGLFVKKDLKKGEIVCEYEGEIVPWSVCEKRAEEGHEGYAFFITKNKCIDAYFTKDAIGRYANDAKGIGRVEGLRNNAQYEIKTRQGEKRVFIVATRTIKANDEVLVDYGKDYWKNLSKAKDLTKKVDQEKKKAQSKAKKK
ncbi:MAG: SET domain-containing protein-lysine N-methyltransferase [Bacteroidota bacterium]